MIFIFFKKLVAQFQKITSITGDVAIRSSCMFSMLSRGENLQRCSFSVNLVCLKRSPMAIQTFPHSSHLRQYGCQSKPRDCRKANYFLKHLFIM